MAGFLDVIGDVISAPLNLIGSLISNNSQRTQTDLTNAANRDIAAQTNATSREIAAENVQLQRDENRLNREYNSLEAEKAYSRELEKMRQSYEYQMQLNSPVEMVKRLREAGLNPALAYGDAGSMGSVNGGSAPSASYNTGLTPQLPSLVSPTMQQGPAFPNIASGLFDGLVKLHQIQLMKSQSGNLDADTQTLYDTLKEKIRGLQLSNDAQVDINRLRRAFEPFERQLGLSEKWTQIELLTEEAYEAASQGRLNDALKAKADVDKILSDAAAKVKGKEGDLLDEQIKWYGKTQAANINHLNATSDEALSSAVLHRAQSYEIRFLLDDKKALLQSEKALNDKSVEVKTSEIKVNDSLRSKYVHEIAGIIEENIGKQIDNEQRLRLQYYVEEQLKQQILQSKQDYINPFKIVGSGLGFAAGAGLSSVLKGGRVAVQGFGK